MEDLVLPRQRLTSRQFAKARPASAGKKNNNNNEEEKGGAKMSLRKILNKFLVLLLVALVGCGSKTGRHSSSILVGGLNLQVTTSQDTTTGDVTITATPLGNPLNETITSLSYDVEKELRASGGRLPINVTATTSPVMIPYYVSPTETLDDASVLFVTVTARTDQGNTYTGSDSLTLVRVPLFDMGIEFRPHPTSPGMTQLVLTRGTRAIPDSTIINVVADGFDSSGGSQTAIIGANNLSALGPVSSSPFNNGTLTVARIRLSGPFTEIIVEVPTTHGTTTRAIMLGGQ